jgi:CheY-like chemotaxis protein
MTHAPQRLRVLVVDDDDAIRELLDELLTRDGFDVTAVADPTQVEEVVRAQRFHLALLDLMMPRQDGIETLRRLRLVDRDLAVIIVTGYPSLDTAVDAMKLEAMDYLRKPFSVEELRAVIERTLRKKGLTRAPEEQLLRAVGDAVRRLRKTHGQLPSKMRFVSAQILALLTDGLWRRPAAHANAMASRLAAAVRGIPGVTITQPVQANAVFVILPPEASARLQARHGFSTWNPATREVRWMCSWDTTPEDVDEFAADVARELGR